MYHTKGNSLACEASAQSCNINDIPELFGSVHSMGLVWVTDKHVQ